MCETLVTIYINQNPPTINPVYRIEAVHPTGCIAIAKGINYNSTKSNYANRLTTNISNTNNNRDLNVYPNPYTGKTQITYTLTEKANVSLEVLNVLGEKVKTIVKEKQNPGKYQYSFSAKDLGYGEGMYIVKLLIDENIYMKKLIEF